MKEDSHSMPDPVEDPKNNPKACCNNSSCCTNFSRKKFLGLMGMGTLGMLSSGIPAMAGPFRPTDFEDLIPADKKLKQDWVKSLFERGEPTVYRNKELDKIEYLLPPLSLLIDLLLIF